jgi:solute carrier family 35 protein C2
MASPDLMVLAILNTLGAGIFAFAMIFVELALLHRTSSMTLSVIGYVKQILQIIISVLIFNNQLTPLNIAGMFVTFIGIIA